MAILLEQNAEQTLNVKGSKLDLASYCEIEQIDEVREEDKKLPLKEETGRIHPVVNEYVGDQREAIACSNEREGFSIEGLDRLNSSMEVHTISDPSMPVYTGYPAPGLASYVPYTPTDGVYYHNLQAVDYNYVHIQPPYGCNIPTGIPYVPQPNGYVPLYPYNFYQMASPEQYGGAYTAYTNTDQLPVILQDHGSGYAIELDNVCDNVLPQVAFTYNPQRLLRASAPVWNNTNSEKTKEKEDAHSSKSKLEGDHVLSSVSSSLSGHDTKTKGFSDDGKKQYRRVVSAGSVLSRKAWPSQVGAFQYVAVTQTPSKVLLRNHQERSDSDTAVSSAKLAKGPDTNLSDFSLDSGDAKHFVIKSFSEENVFRSIEHGVWSSTPSGNHKLNVAFQESQERALAKGNNNKCPMFLYFSVNGSGRFCGVAEMVGSVEFKKTMEFWDRNKWCGSFPVKWHIIKDVPNSQLRRIILQNNENKPVTSSRDTQEICNHRQGLEMLNIFKNYSTKVSILDRFPNLSTRQNIVNYDKQEISGEDERDQQPSNEERGFVKPTEIISSNPIKAWNTGSKHPDDNNVLKKRKPLLPGKVAQDLNVNNVVGKEPKKENVVTMPYGGVKA